MSEKLKPCPFCGGEACWSWYGGGRDRGCIKCNGCWAKSVLVEPERKSEAIAAWNRRAEVSDD